MVLIAKIMRCKDGTPQHQSLLQKTKSAELYPVLDSLNQLASTPWIINKPVSINNQQVNKQLKIKKKLTVAFVGYATS